MKSLLLFGGNSDEKLVSVASAQNLALSYNFDELIFWHHDGALLVVNKNELLNHKNPFSEEFKPKNILKSFANLELALDWLKSYRIFIGLHGTQGEDGSLQSIFEKNKISFTGSNSESSHLCFHKELAKTVAEKNGLRIAKGLLLKFKEKDLWPEQIKDFSKQVKGLVLKPTASGSSFGLKVLRTLQNLDAAIADIMKNNLGDYLIEEFIQGRELTTGVIEWQGCLKALPASEVILNQGFEFDYQGKYMGLGSKEITPAQISSEQMQLSQDLALKAHQALGCRGYSRTDMILTDNEVVFIETNTLPGMTKASFFPQQLQAAGYKTTDFIQELLHL